LHPSDVPWAAIGGIGDESGRNHGPKTGVFLRPPGLGGVIACGRDKISRSERRIPVQGCLYRVARNIEPLSDALDVIVISSECSG
jgi:hypothetical protein